MYNLSLKKIEKKINPYFEINIRFGFKNETYPIYTDSLEDLKQVLINIKMAYLNIKNKLKEENSEKYKYKDYIDAKVEFLEDEFKYLKIGLNVDKEKKEIKTELSDKELNEYIQEEKFKIQKKAAFHSMDMLRSYGSKLLKENSKKSSFSFNGYVKKLWFKIVERYRQIYV